MNDPSLPSDAPAASSAIPGLHAVILVLFAGSATAFVLNSEPLRSANDRSRWSTVWSLVERGTYQIDEIDALPRWQTIDKVRHRRSEDDQWHYYSTKPPLTPTLVAGLYYVLRKTTGLRLYRDTAATTRIILLLINVLPMLLALWLYSGFLARRCNSPPASVFVLATAGFGTFLTPFLTTFNNHVLAATAVLITLCLAARILLDGSRSPVHFALCGLFAMWACCNELPAALFGLLLFGQMLRVDAARTWRWFVPAALIPLLAFVATNYAATGSWKPFYMYYGTDRYVFTVEGVPSYWSNPAGLDANSESPLVYLLHCVVGHHGVLSLTPVFALSLIGVVTRKSWQTAVRPFLLPTVVLTLGVLGFYLSRTRNYNYGGTTAALRWAFWLIPYWLFAMIPVVERWWLTPRRRAVALALLGLSVASALSAANNPWSHPWLYRLMEARGWIDYSTPPPQLDHPLQTWLGTLPSPAPNTSYTARYTSDGLPADQFRLALLPGEGDPILRIEAPTVGLDRFEATVNRERLEAGQPPAKFLTPLTGSEADLPRAARFLQGTPTPVAYRARRYQYLHLRFRADAYRCLQASATASQRTPPRRHRCDVWLTPDIPFGPAKVQTSVTDARSGQVLSRRTWTLWQRGTVTADSTNK